MYGHATYRKIACIILFFLSNVVLAGNYSFPAYGGMSMPTGCTGSGTSYTCSSLNLAWNDTVSIINANTTVTVNGNLYASKSTINATGCGNSFLDSPYTASGFILVVKGNALGASGNGLCMTGSGSVSGGGMDMGNGKLVGNWTISDTFLTGTGGTAVVVGDVSAAGNITLGYATQMTGSLQGGAAITTNSNVVVNGPITALGNVTTGSGNTINGAVTSSGGAVSLGGTGSNNVVRGNVTAAGAITVASGSSIYGNVNSTNGLILINSSGTLVDGSLSTTGDVNIGANTVIKGSVSGNKVEPVYSGSYASPITIGGDVNANTSFILGNSSTLYGSLTTATAQLMSSNATVNGNAYISNTITLNSQGRVKGYVQCTGSAYAGGCGCVIDNSGLSGSTSTKTYCSAPTTRYVNCSGVSNANLIVNGDAESGTASWNVTSGNIVAWSYTANDGWSKPTPVSGTRFFGSSGVALATAYQNVSVSALAGKAFKLSARMGSYQNTDSAELKVYFKDGSGSTLATYTTGKVTTNSVLNIQNVVGTVPSAAVTATVEMNMVRTSGSDADGFFDDIYFGSAVASYSTINSAIAAASAGDVISICAGTYNESVNVGVGGITITSDSGNKDVIVAPSSGDAMDINPIISPSAVTVKNLVLNGKSKGLYFVAGLGHIVKNTTITTSDTGQAAVAVNTNACPSLIDGATITSGGSGAAFTADWIDCPAGYGITIQNSTLTSPSGWGMNFGSNGNSWYGPHVFKNLTINASAANQTGIYLKKCAQTFDGLTINAGGTGIQCGDVSNTNPSFTGLTINAGGVPVNIDGGTPKGDIIVGTSSAPVVMNGGSSIPWSNGALFYANVTMSSPFKFVFTNTTINSTASSVTSSGASVIGLWNSAGGPHQFINTKVTATGASMAGIVVRKGGYLFDGVTVSTASDAISVWGADAAKPFTLLNSTITSSAGNGVYVSGTTNGGVVGSATKPVVIEAASRGIDLASDTDGIGWAFNNVTVNAAKVAQGNNNSIIMGGNAGGSHSFSKMNVTCKVSGCNALNISKGSSIYIDNSYFETLSGGGSGYSGPVYIASSGSVTAAGVTVKCNDTTCSAFNTNGSVTSLSATGVCTSDGAVGIVNTAASPYINLNNNSFSGYSRWGVHLENTTTTGSVTGNCFNTATSVEGFSKSTLGFSNNYWKGVAGGSTYQPGGNWYGVTNNLKDTATASTCAVNTATCYTPSSATLVGDWHMDEPIWNGVANEVVDSSASAYHGTGMNGANTAVGQVCSAGKFDGVNDYVALPTVNKDFSATGISMAAWVKGEASGAGRYWERIFDLASSQYNMLLLARNASSNDLTFEIYDTNTGNTCGKNTIPSFFDGTMHHVVATVDASKVVKIYKDGVLALTGSTSCLPGNISRSSSYIGRSNYSGDNYFKGLIDEAKVWTGALSASEVAAGYANEKLGKSWDGSSRTCSAMLVAEYHLEDASWSGSAGEVKDSVGSAHGKIIGKVTSTKATPALSGSPGTCGYASMNETSAAGGAIEVTGLPVSTTAGDKTSVAFWLYWNGGDVVMPMGWGKHDLFFWSDKFGFNTGNSDVFGISGASAKLANGWHHVVAVFTNGSVTGNAIYIDGVAQALSQQINSPNTANAVVQSTAHFGGWTNDSGYRLGSRIDEIKVFKGAVNQAQVNALYTERHNCAAMVADWRMDESAWAGAASEVKDTTSNTFHGKALDGATTTTGKVCRAGSFDGSYDAVSLPSIPADFSNGITFAAWAKGDATCSGCGRNYERLIDLGNGAANDNILWMRRGETNDLSFEVYLGGSSCGQYPVPNMFDGNLHHYAVTLDSGRNIAVYRDGALVSSGTYGCVPNKVTRNSTYLGKSNWSGDAYFKGLLDEVKIWNYGLSASEISAGYANENSGKRWDGSDTNCGATPVLKARMDEASWSTANSVIDTSGKGHNGTPMNGAKTLKCGSKQVGYFSNGAYVDFGNHTDLSPQASSAQAITIGAWVKADYTNLVGSPTLAGSGYQALFNKISKPGDGYKNEWLLHIYTNSLPGDRFMWDFWSPGGSSYGGLSRSANIGWTEDTAGTCSGSVYGEHKACWHFVALSWDYANKKWATYVIRPDLTDMANPAASGIREDYQTDVLNQGPPTDTASPPTNLWIGTADYYGNRHFVGMMRGAILAKGAMSQAELRDWAISTWPDPCDNPVSAPSKLNAVDVGKNAVSGVIGTKIAGSAFSVDVYALKSDNSGVDTTWGGDVGVDIVDGGSCSSSSTPIATASTAATLVSGAKTSFVMPTVSDAYKNLRVRLRYPATGTATLVACSTDNFALRPNAFGLVLQDQDWATAGTVRSLTSVIATAGPVHKAAQPFTMTATGYNAAATPAITSNYSGNVDLTLATSTCSGGTACTTALGVLSSLSGTTGTLTLTASSGTASTNLKYSEVGAFSVQVQDKTYTAVDASDGTAADCSGLWICSNTTPVGRFVPDHYDVTVSSAQQPKFQTFGVSSSTCSNRSFTYVGQTIGFASDASGNVLVPKATVSAKNADGATTANFAGALWRLTSSGLSVGTRTCKQSDNSAGAGRTDCVLGWSISTPSNLTNYLVSNGDGTGTYTWPKNSLVPNGIKLSFGRESVVAPFWAFITLGLSIDDKSETANVGAGATATTIKDTQTAYTWPDVAFDAGSEFRFGRLRLFENSGPSSVSLPIAVAAEYAVSGSNFNTNTADNCTTILPGDMKLSDGTLTASKVSLPTASVRLVNGQNTILLGSPGASEKGYVFLCVDLGADAPSQRVCTGGVSASGYPYSYLQTGSSFNADPSAKASFGDAGGAAKRLFYMMQ